LATGSFFPRIWDHYGHKSKRTLHITDSHGVDATDYAVSQSNLSEIELLVDLGALRVRVASQTMLNFAAEAGLLHVVNFVLDIFLLQHGDSPREHQKN
jgi:hypothetical protein